MKKQKSNNSALLGGSFIIIIGLTLLAMTNGWLGLDKNNFWPAYLILPGVFSLILASTAGTWLARSLFVLFGTTPLLLGLFFFLFTYDIYAWKEMNTLWPAFLIIPGIAQLAAYYASERKIKPFYFIGASLLLAGAVFLLFTLLDSSYAALNKVWPLFVILIGLGLILAARKKR
jgi:hypothetical protein